MVLHLSSDTSDLPLPGSAVVGRFGSQLLISREVLAHCGDQGRGAAPLGAVQVKGRGGTLELYRIA